MSEMEYGSHSFVVVSRHLMDNLKEFTSLTIQSGDVSYADVAFETYDKGCSGPFSYEAVYDDDMVWVENVTDTKPYMVCTGNHEVGYHSTCCLSLPLVCGCVEQFHSFQQAFCHAVCRVAMACTTCDTHSTMVRCTSCQETPRQISRMPLKPPRHRTVIFPGLCKMWIW